MLHITAQGIVSQRRTVPWVTNQTKNNICLPNKRNTLNLKIPNFFFEQRCCAIFQAKVLRYGEVFFWGSIVRRVLEEEEIKRWAEADSNRRHLDFQSSALPTELSARPVLLSRVDYT